MSDLVDSKIDALKQMAEGNKWKVLRSKPIPSGQQVNVSDGVVTIPINFYDSGKVVVQGKACELQTRLREWSVELETGQGPEETATTIQNRAAKYFVIPPKIENIRGIIGTLIGEVVFRDQHGPAETYRADAHMDGKRVTITQYNSGTLMVQGLSSPYFDLVCETLDEHLAQSFSERASRFVTGEAERTAVSVLLDQPEAENTAAAWLSERTGSPNVAQFLFENDQRTLLAAAGVWLALLEIKPALPEYSVVVMPFAKPYEGFIMRLAIHLQLTTEEAVKKSAGEIEIGSWIDQIKSRLPDPKRNKEVHSALEAAWQCRHKAVHSDFASSLSTIRTLMEAEQEISTILRAMERAYRLFVEESLLLTPLPPAPPAKPSTPPKSTR